MRFAGELAALGTALASLGMALTLGGIFMVVGERGRAEPARVEGSPAAGVVAGIFGAVGQAAGFVLSKQALITGIDPLSATVVRIATAVVFGWALALAGRQAARAMAALRDRRAAAFMVGGAFFGPRSWA